MPTDHTYAHEVEARLTRMPDTGETVNGSPFVVPKGAKNVTIHCPALVGAATTVKVQAMVPQAPGVTTETFQDVSMKDTVGTVALSVAEDLATVIPIGYVPGGILRLVASADQSSVPVTIPVSFEIDK